MIVSQHEDIYYLNKMKSKKIYYAICLFIANATKICTEDGQWFISEDTHDTWTNYTMCFYRGDYEPSHSIEVIY